MSNKSIVVLCLLGCIVSMGLIADRKSNKTAGEALEDELLCEWIIKYAPIAPQEGK